MYVKVTAKTIAANTVIIVSTKKSVQVVEFTFVIFRPVTDFNSLTEFESTKSNRTNKIIIV